MYRLYCDESYLKLTTLLYRTYADRICGTLCEHNFQLTQNSAEKGHCKQTQMLQIDGNINLPTEYLNVRTLK